jgi:hypothetical protein
VSSAEADFDIDRDSCRRRRRLLGAILYAV